MEAYSLYHHLLLQSKNCAQSSFKEDCPKTYETERGQQVKERAKEGKREEQNGGQDKKKRNKKEEGKPPNM
jgi:hypothetical protein